MKSILAAALACVTLQASAQVYKCQGAEGTVYSSAPCAPGAAPLNVRPASGPSTPPTPKTQIWRRAHDLKIGMSADDAQQIWGPPARVNRSTTATGTREQWVYGHGYKHEYLYFQNGKLVTIHD